MDEYSDFTLERFRHPGDAALNIWLVSSAEIRTNGAAQSRETTGRTGIQFMVWTTICVDFGADLAFSCIDEPYSCLHELAANRVSNKARRRIYVELAHSGCSMRLRRLDAEIQHRAHALVAVPFRNQFNDRLLSR